MSSIYLHSGTGSCLAWPSTNFVTKNGVPFGSQIDLYNYCTNHCHCTNHFGQYDFHEFLCRPCTNHCHCTNRDLAAKSIRTRFGTSICYFSCIPYVALTNHAAAHNNQQKTTTTHGHYPTRLPPDHGQCPPHQALGKIDNAIVTALEAGKSVNVNVLSLPSPDRWRQPEKQRSV